MKNCEKSILVCYINIGNLDKQRGIIIINELDKVIKERFNKDKIVEDDSLVILTIPVQDQPTKVELLNARYPNYEELLEQTKNILKEEFKNIKS